MVMGGPELVPQKNDVFYFLCQYCYTAVDKNQKVSDC